MLIILGALIVVGSVFGGFMMHGGHLMALWQPSEVIIICGAALGGMVTATPLPTLKGVVQQAIGVLGSSYNRKDYLDLLVMMYEIFNVARRDGLVGLENHIEHPKDSDIFKRYPKFLKNHHAVDFFSDTMRVIISGSVQPHDLEDLMDADLEKHHHEQLEPAGKLSFVADSLPGLGIVAAVLGIVITMGYVNESPEVIGHKVAAALCGTFLGLFLAYGFISPLASSMMARVNADAQYFASMKHALLSFHKGVAGVIAVEFARRSLASDVRPTFIELENACNEAKRR